MFPCSIYDVHIINWIDFKMKIAEKTSVFFYIEFSLNRKPQIIGHCEKHYSITNTCYKILKNCISRFILFSIFVILWLAYCAVYVKVNDAM